MRWRLRGEAAVWLLCRASTTAGLRALRQAWFGGRQVKSLQDALRQQQAEGVKEVRLMEETQREMSTKMALLEAQLAAGACVTCVTSA